MGNLHKRAPIGVGIIVKRDNYILLGKRKGAHAPGTWAFPGGKPDPGENPRDAAIRELLEETSIDVSANAHHVQPLPRWTYDRFEDEELHYVTLYFVVNCPPDQTAVVTEPEKCEEWRWVYKDSLYLFKQDGLFAGVESAFRSLNAA